MSHITTAKTEIMFNDESMIEQAIREMAKTFHGMRIERPYPDVILVRYPPIEKYQTEGNLQFVRNKETGIWEMQYDFWRCQSEVEQVRDALCVEYQKAGIMKFCTTAGFLTTTQKTKGGVLLTATKY